MNSSEPILVAAGIVRQGERILICQRHHSDPYGMQWEFPGGKARAGESLPLALARELDEELGIQAEVGAELARLRHRYPDRYVEVAFFEIKSYGGELTNRVFEKIEWAARKNLPEYDFLEADRDLVRQIAQGAIL